ncbi:putative flippase GtrA [Lysobacter niabensis]|uniref:Flippase GtrA n=1 Tax=Agrilutibacter niabensis TaxID=380628 RepID=A0ABU1VUM1_9GAMM|nr:GtrA family protein [Lysobacter niabensis]MDR7100828.1 putative flippase GtrA [Lysobacter niabensis]
MIAVFSRYAAVQIAAYGMDMGSFLLATIVFGWAPLPSNILAKILAGGLAFFAHRRITFGVHGKGGGRAQLIKYILLLALNVPVSSGVLALLLPYVGPEALAKFVSDVICVGITFFLSRRLIFVAPTTERGGT